MSDKKLWEQYVALEKERDTLRSDLAEFQYAAAVANDTIKALQAKVEQMERQEPECEVVGQVRNVLYEVRTLKYDLPAGTKLYALPGAQAQPASSIPVEAIGKMLADVMAVAVSNGANSVSMPDEYVEVAVWLQGECPTQPAPSVPEGWQLVPIEPTQEMLDATSWPNCAGTDYKKMLAAAPRSEAKP